MSANLQLFVIWPVWHICFVKLNRVGTASRRATACMSSTLRRRGGGDLFKGIWHRCRFLVKTS